MRSERYFVERGANARSDDRWMQVLLCVHWHIYPHGGQPLVALTDKRGSVATRLGKLAAIDTTAGESADVATALATYTGLFEFLMWFGIGTGIFMIIISPILRRWMHGVH